ncbi:MAG: hypothetical protein IT340_20050 [Chloroflexi bacterium]|nr:hypothetical protein [Chloroflexota bacterium]
MVAPLPMPRPGAPMVPPPGLPADMPPELLLALLTGAAGPVGPGLPTPPGGAPPAMPLGASPPPGVGAPGLPPEALLALLAGGPPPGGPSMGGMPMPPMGRAALPPPPPLPALGGGPGPGGDPLAALLAGIPAGPPPAGGPLGGLLPEVMPENRWLAPLPQPKEAARGSASHRRKRKTAPRKPDLTTIKRRADDAVNYWALRDARMDQDYAIYRLSKESYTGPGELVLRALPYIFVEKAAALIGKQKPDLSVVPPRNDLREEAQALKDYLLHWWVTQGDQWSDTLQNALRRDLAHFLALRGWAAVRITCDPTAECCGPEEQPVRLLPVDPRQVYPEVGTRGLRSVTWRYLTTVGALLDEWPEAAKLYGETSGRTLTQTVQVTAYYDDWYHAVWCDAGDLKDVTAHEYGFVPWVIGVGMGSPIRATSNDTTAWVAEVGVPVFHGLRDTYRQLNRTLSQLATEVAKAANPPLLYYFDPANPDQPKSFSYAPGTINFLAYQREQVEVMKTTPGPGETRALLESLQQDVDMVLSPALFGAGAAPSGYAQTLMAEAAEDTLWPLVEAMARMLRVSSRHCLELVRDHYDGEVGYLVRDADGEWVGGVTITPDLVEQVGTEVMVNFKSISPRDQVMLGNLAIALTDKKLLSMETARSEYLNVENPGRENDRVLAELMYLKQEVVDMLTEYRVAKDMPELYPLYQEAMAKKGAPPSSGPPPGLPMPPGAGPGGPPPGLPPTVLPPIAQAAALDPAALLNQSLGSAAGGLGIPAPQGLPGIGGQLPPPMPVLPGMV